MAPGEAPAAAGGSRAELRRGVAYGLAAYASWGLVPVYFKALAGVAPLEVLAHRVLWSIALLAVLLSISGRWRSAVQALRDPRTRLALAGSTLLVATNWFTFIYAVATSRVLEASLGYYINPLVNVALGRLFLGERLRGVQKVSLVLAAAGVGYATWEFGRVPVLALVLAVSFGLYGLLRKTARVGSLVGLALETALLCPLALGYLTHGVWSGRAAFLAGSAGLDGLLLPAGVVTAVPLLCFAAAARRLRLATMGFLQYLSPTIQFALAVAVFGEAFRTAHLVTFLCIWAGLGLYTCDALRRARA